MMDHTRLGIRTSKRSLAMIEDVRVVRAVALAIALAASGTTSDAAQAGSLDVRTVLARAGKYVTQYQREFSLLLADEHYLQEVTTANEGPSGDATRTPGGVGATTEGRALVSEFALVRVQDGDRARWLAFRDVVEVDGRAVGDRQERLQRLFLDAPVDALAQARAIALESARYNIGDLVRTVNVPTLALEFLESAAQERSRFTKTGEDTVQGVRAWVVSFEERARPSLIKTPGGRDVPTMGLAWIDPETGRILKTQIDPQLQRGHKTRITATYAPDERLALWVPVEMQEVYERESRIITGEAKYTNFRRFDTEVRLKGVK
jgi:hypothetical protein